jgi:hypothetical protein
MPHLPDTMIIAVMTLLIWLGAIQVLLFSVFAIQEIWRSNRRQMQNIRQGRPPPPLGDLLREVVGILQTAGCRTARLLLPCRCQQHHTGSLEGTVQQHSLHSHHLPRSKSPAYPEDHQP